ncbi:unnamed protein product [Zymoseptoria tritici ST99CH_1A5]|nr:unnamed protein product [Zymoseptoria tritici ST99CH_1E4]SMY23290.1 unnamed protein product [Zymoseptoria tritici ST99CH_1A5]
MALPPAIMIPRSVCRSCVRYHAQVRHYIPNAKPLSESESRLPRVANPSFWSSLIPRPFRRPVTEAEVIERALKRSAGAEERRTGIKFLVLGILVGSNAINLISIKRDMLNFTRQTDAKLELLREVVQKVKNGEDVDVKQALGTGDPEHEKEWEQVMKELEETDMLLEGRKKREAKRQQKEQQRRIKEEDDVRAAQPAPAEGASEAQKTSQPKFLM